MALVLALVPHRQPHSFVTQGSADLLVTVSASGLLGTHSWLPYDRNLSNYFSFSSISVRFQILSHLGYYKILSTVPRALQQVLLFIYFIHSSVCMLIPNSQSIPPLPSSPLVTISLFSMSVSLLL